MNPTSTTPPPPPSFVRQVIPGVSQRTDFELVGDRCALLVIDVQQYLSLPRHAADAAAKAYFYQQACPAAVRNITKLVDAFRVVRDQTTTTTTTTTTTEPTSLSFGHEVIFTYLQSATKDGRDISLDYKLSGPDLANIPRIQTDFDHVFLPHLAPNPVTGRGDLLLPKTSCNVFVSTNLDYLLRNLGIQQIVMVGQLTDECVSSAVRTAADLGYLVTVVSDACASTTPSKHERGLESVQGFARIVTTEQLLQEVLRGITSELQHDATASTTTTTATTTATASSSNEEASPTPVLNDDAIVAYLRRKGLYKAAQQIDVLLTVQGIATSEPKTTTSGIQKNSNSSSGNSRNRAMRARKPTTEEKKDEERKTSPMRRRVRRGVASSGGGGPSATPPHSPRGPSSSAASGRNTATTQTEHSTTNSNAAMMSQGDSDTSFSVDDLVSQRPVHVRHAAKTTASPVPKSGSTTATRPPPSKSPKTATASGAAQTQTQLPPPPPLIKSPRRGKAKAKVVVASDISDKMASMSLSKTKAATPTTAGEDGDDKNGTNNGNTGDMDGHGSDKESAASSDPSDTPQDEPTERNSDVGRIDAV